MDVTPESVRQVRFREKLRGYHPDDVDEFVASVAATLEALHARIADLERRASEVAEATTHDAEESLRRTLILAQRTADLAVAEAREEASRMVEEATRQRDSVLAEAEAERARLRAELDGELRIEREHLEARRDALRADVAALEAHVERERERLRIYFTDQLRRLDEGQPGVAPAPEMQAPVEPEAAEAEAPSEVPADEVAPADEAAVSPAFEAEARAASPYDELRHLDEDEEDDAFIAELRQAVSDTTPLGPRDDPGPAQGDEEGDGDDVDLFADREGGRFGFRRRK